MCAQSDGKLGTHRLFTLYRNAFCHATKKAIWSIMNSNDPGRRKSFTRIEHRASAIGRERLVRSIPVLTPEYLLCFLSEGFRPRSYILNCFLDGPSGCSHFTSVWLKSYLIFDTPLSRSARRSFPTSQKSRRHNRSCVRTEAPSDMIFVAAPKLSGKMWT